MQKPIFVHNGIISNIPTTFGIGQNAPMAWHGYHKRVSKEATQDYALALEELELNYKLDKMPSSVAGFEKPNSFEIVRLNDDGTAFAVLSEKTVSERYNLPQNSQLMEAITQFIGAGYAIDSMGVIGHGLTFFVNLRLRCFEVAPGDEHFFFVQLVSKVDGKSPRIFMKGFGRMVCSNTITMAINSATKAGDVLKFRNTNAGNVRMNDMVAVAGLLASEFSDFEEKLRFLQSVRYSKDLETEVLKRLYPGKVKDGKLIESEMLDAIMQTDGANGIMAVENSAYSVLNKLTAYADSFQAAKGLKLGDGANYEQRRGAGFASSMFGTLAAVKANAFDTVLSVARAKA